MFICYNGYVIDVLGQPLAYRYRDGMVDDRSQFQAFAYL